MKAISPDRSFRAEGDARGDDPHAVEFVGARDDGVLLRIQAGEDVLGREVGKPAFERDFTVGSASGWHTGCRPCAPRTSSAMGNTSRISGILAASSRDQRLLNSHAPPTTALQPVRAWLRALRPSHWVKNLLVYVPLIASHQLFDTELLIRGTYAFAAFSLCASSIYILNDLADVEADRQHPKKRFRPFASGALSPTLGAIAALALLAFSGLGAVVLVGPSFLALLALYLGLTTAYTFYFKREPIADVIVLASLYVLRVVAGGVALDIALSNWLLAFALFLFLSLAFLKRYTEIKLSPNLPAINLVAGRGYRYSDADWLQAIGTTSGYLAVLVLALYVNSEDVTLLYSRPSLLLLLCPLCLYWISRTWFRAHRETLVDDPIVTALGDPASYIVAVAATAVLLAAL